MGFLNGGFLCYGGLGPVFFLMKYLLTDSVDMRYSAEFVDMGYLAGSVDMGCSAGSVDMGWSPIVVGVGVYFFYDYVEPRVLGIGSCS